MKSINKMEDTEVAYLAGIIDGEGSISIVRRKSKRYYGSNYGYSLVIGVTNTKIELVHWVQDKTGLGNISKGMAGSVRAAIPYRWFCWSREAEQILKVTLQYLVIKEDQARLALGFISSMKNRGPRTSQEIERQRMAYEGMLELNKKGPQ